MPRHHPGPLLAALAVLAAAGTAPAQLIKPKIEITSARVGFPAGPRAGQPDGDGNRDTLYKAGAWVPVFVDVLVNKEYEGPAEVVVETPDGEQLVTRARVQLPALQPNDNYTAVVYTKPASTTAEFSVTLRIKDADVGPPAQPSGFGGKEPNQVLYLSAGSRLANIKLPNVDAKTPAPNPLAVPASVAAVTAVRDLPTQWFGYSGVDLVVLTTSNADFVNGLINDTDGRLAALTEWVRRGGKLLVSVGANTGRLGTGFLPDVLPVGFGPARALTGLTIKVRSETLKPMRAGAGKIETPALEPKADRPVRVWATAVDVAAETDAGRFPLVVQAPYGLGRVTVVGFDLDVRALAEWEAQEKFWEGLLLEAGPPVPGDRPANAVPGQFRRGVPITQTAGDMQDELLGHLDTFEGVPVIQFGWVALFILAYIIVVGPLDYLFLKKVVKRMELTWVTFPTVVIVVSVVAYLAAYRLKGNDLKVNKVDVVDIDLQTKKVFGTSYFTVFSPRIQNYTIGVDPAPGWAAPATAEKPGPTPLVSWLGKTRDASNRSLFKRSYDYAPGYAGLVNVPIQVWATKNFVASWQADADPAAPPVQSGLFHPPGSPNRPELAGDLTSQLPGPLEEATLIYGGQAYALGELLPGQKKVLTRENPREAETWLRDIRTGYHPWRMMFAEKYERNTLAPANGNLRELDESWRLTADNRSEAILVGRLKAETGPAEAVTKSPATASRLWLGELPKADGTGQWPGLQGSLRQETFVRVFIPVK